MPPISEVQTSNPIVVFICVFLLAFFCSLATLLVSDRVVDMSWKTIRTLIGTPTISGFTSLAICLILYDEYQQQIFALVGVCLLASLCGVTASVIANWVQGGLGESLRRLIQKEQKNDGERNP